jgi:hypothetical protein
MAVTDKYLYNLISCDAGSYPSILSKHTNITPSPFAGQVVQIVGYPLNQRYTVTLIGLNAGISTGNMPPLGTTALNACADAIGTRLFEVYKCGDIKTVKRVLLAVAYPIGTVLKFTTSDFCWTVSKLISNYDEAPPVGASFASCVLCMEAVAANNCAYDERTIGYAVKVAVPKTAPADRGFAECCYTNLVFGDLSSTNKYKNDFSSVFYQRQTPADTVTYQLIGVSTGITALVDGTHGVLYPFGGTQQPNLSYFKVEWKKILSLFGLGEDTYTIRMLINIAGVSFTQDTFPYSLRQFSIALADKTARIDSKINGKLVRINTDFKNTGYENSLRFKGFFGNRQASFEQDNVVFSSKNGQPYYEDQIIMSNKWDYLFNAYNIPECMAKLLYEELIFGNELFASDYNLNNHSYQYELLPVILTEDNNQEYQVFGRGANINLKFADRLKDNLKTNC